VKAIIPSHAHLDHIGAIPYLADKYDADIICTPFTAAVIKSILSDEKITTEIGRMKVQAIFRKEKGSMIVGGKVEQGKAMKKVLARVKRDGLGMGTGKIVECKVGQGAVKEAGTGTECGVKFEGSVKIEEGDVLEFYTEETKAREIVFK